jgi:hypothetical protein
MGPEAHALLLDPDTEHKVLGPGANGAEGSGLILFNERTRMAVLITDGLPQESSDAYTLRIQEGTGAPEELKRFGSTGGLQGFDVGTLTVASLATVTITITDSLGNVILSSA